MLDTILQRQEKTCIYIMLEFKNIKLSYSTKEVLKGLNLQIQSGDIHGILGMNGAGKTTLFRSIYGFLKPTSGSFHFNEKILLQKQIAFLETENYFYSFMKGREYLELLSDKEKSFDIDAWNALFELPLQQFTDAYSTGMKKKLAFLGVLALQRPIFILDEPFNGVDIESNEKISLILERLKAQGKTIIISSHIIQSLTKICDKISYLNNGVIERTYDKKTFPELEKELADRVKAGIGERLDGLLGN